MIVNEQDVRLLTGKFMLFSDILKVWGPPPAWKRPPGFASLARIILEQQVSLASAEAHFNKLQSHIIQFTPENILALTDVELRRCQVSRQKAEYLRALSRVLANDNHFLDRLVNMEAAEARNRLTAIKGVGHWTTDIYLMFCLQEKDIFPVGDIAVVRTMRELTPAHTKEEMNLLAQSWTPLRSLATYFLWHHYLCKRIRQVPGEGGAGSAGRAGG